MPLLLPGYSGVVWNTARAALVYANANMNLNNLQQSKVLARAVAATLKNTGTALVVNMLYQALQQLYANLAPIPPLSLNLGVTNNIFLQTRINAIQAAAASISGLLVTPLPVASQLASGQPAVPDPKLLEWLANFSFELAPPSLTAGNLGATAQASADAWTAIAAALLRQGVVYSGTSFNVVNLMNRVSQVAANAAANASPSSLISTSQIWNQFAAMPSIIKAAMATASDPTSQVAQNTAVIRYVLLNTLQQYNKLIVSLRQVVTSQLRLGTLKQNDTLMTFANRELNDYTAWRRIAQLNGLQPPYISGTPGPNVAVPGQQLFLPAPNTTAPLAPQTAPIGNYITNYLGVDRFLGQLNQPMLPWTGDYQIISGNDNLAFSLGRRLQTTLGSLMYHNLFGSRIPPEIGKITGINELQLIRQYSISCLMSDPRVNKILSCAVAAGPNYSVSIMAVVLPNGLGQEEVTVNEVIGPA